MEVLSVAVESNGSSTIRRKEKLMSSTIYLVIFVSSCVFTSVFMWHFSLEPVYKTIKFYTSKIPVLFIWLNCSFR